MTDRNPTTIDLDQYHLDILSYGTTADGAMADPIADATLEWCEQLVSAGLLRRGEPIGYIRTYFTTQAGLRAIHRSVN